MVTIGHNRPRPQWLLRAAQLGLGLAGGILLAEATLWVVAPVRFHEWMLWVPDGHIKGRAEPGQVFQTAAGFDVRINDLGFRGPDYAWEPEPGTLRLAAFGGSSTFCYHAAGEENTWPGRLDSYLTEALGMPVEVINLGLPGYDASTSKINYLVNGRALHPQVALLYHTWNDMKFFRTLERHPLVFTNVSSNKPLWQQIARATQIGRHVRNVLIARKFVPIENYDTSLEDDREGAARPVQPVAFEWARKNYEDFVAFTRTDGVLPVLISQATIVVPENLDKKEYGVRLGMSPRLGMTLPLLAGAWLEMRSLLEDVARSKDAVYVDGYAAVPHDLEHLADHVHLTDKGADALARAVAQTLLTDERFLDVVQRVRESPPSRGM